MRSRCSMGARLLGCACSRSGLPGPTTSSGPSGPWRRGVHDRPDGRRGARRRRRPASRQRAEPAHATGTRGARPHGAGLEQCRHRRGPRAGPARLRGRVHPAGRPTGPGRPRCAGDAAVVRGAVGCLLFSFGLKHALAGGAPGGIDAGFYTNTHVEVLALVVSQMQYAAWWGVIAAAACAAVLVFAHRVLPTWFGVVSAGSPRYRSAPACRTRPGCWPQSGCWPPALRSSAPGTVLSPPRLVGKVRAYPPDRPRPSGPERRRRLTIKPTRGRAHLVVGAGPRWLGDDGGIGIDADRGSTALP